MTGFQAPNYTQVPNDFFELAMAMDTAELRVLICLMRATFGFHRPSVVMSIRQLAREARLTPKSVMAGAVLLEGRGLITRSVLPSNITTWECVIESSTPLRDLILQGVIPATAKSGVKERINKQEKESNSGLIFQFFEQEIGPITFMIADELKDMAETYTDEWLHDAIAEASKMQHRNIKYIGGILRNWKAKGREDHRRQGRGAARVQARADETQDERTARIMGAIAKLQNA